MLEKNNVKSIYWISVCAIAPKNKNKNLTNVILKNKWENVILLSTQMLYKTTNVKEGVKRW